MSEWSRACGCSGCWRRSGAVGSGAKPREVEDIGACRIARGAAVDGGGDDPGRRRRDGGAFLGLRRGDDAPVLLERAAGGGLPPLPGRGDTRKRIGARADGTRRRSEEQSDEEDQRRDGAPAIAGGNG